MTSQLDHLRPVASPGRVGQGTAVEQSRAVAEVQAQVIVAQQMPRDINRANRDMLRSCAMKSLAEKAFYRYSRGGSQISGASVQLARELARCWGNVQYGITELRRDDAAGQSEMLAFAWDLETNTRSSTTFIVQHVRDVGKTAKPLTEQRDIYENNANNGARRLREMVFAILPGWYTEDAVSACYATLAGDSSDGATVADRAATAAERFGRMHVTQAQLENKLGAPMARWSPSDLAQLTVIWRSIDRGETTADAEFGQSAGRPSAADITGQPPKDASPAAAGMPPEPPATPPPPADAPKGQAAGEAPKPRLATTGQVGLVRKAFERLTGVKDEDETPDQRKERLRLTSRLARVPYPGVESTSELTSEQAREVREALAQCQTAADLEALLDSGALAGDPREDGEQGA